LSLSRLIISALMALILAPAGWAAEPGWWDQAQKEAQAEGYRLIDSGQLQRLMDSGSGYTLLDVRPDYEYQHGHIPGAKNLEFHLGDRLGVKPDKAARLGRLAGPDKARPLVVYCRSFKCLRSGIAARQAVHMGYKKVMRLAEGWHGWLKHTGQNDGGEPTGLGVGDFFPACRLVVLGGSGDRQYLGLGPQTKAFALSEVPADFLFVEFYSQLCYGCLQAVESYNQLFRALSHDPRLSGRVKMLGLGVGSLNREVAKFRKKEGVLFPLFADQGRELFRCLGQPGLPVAYVLRRESANRLRIISILPGGKGQVEEVLSRIQAAVGSAAP